MWGVLFVIKLIGVIALGYGLFLTLWGKTSAEEKLKYMKILVTGCLIIFLAIGLEKITEKPKEINQSIVNTNKPTEEQLFLSKLEKAYELNDNTIVWEGYRDSKGFSEGDKNIYIHLDKNCSYGKWLGERYYKNMKTFISTGTYKLCPICFPDQEEKLK